MGFAQLSISLFEFAALLSQQPFDRLSGAPLAVHRTRLGSLPRPRFSLFRRASTGTVLIISRLDLECSDVQRS